MSAPVMEGVKALARAIRSLNYISCSSPSHSGFAVVWEIVRYFAEEDSAVSLVEVAVDEETRRDIWLREGAHF